jgi:hypothetical protein
MAGEELKGAVVDHADGETNGRMTIKDLTDPGSQLALIEPEGRSLLLLSAMRVSMIERASTCHLFTPDECIGQAAGRGPC